MNPELSGRFLVTALPTIYHVKDGVFRQYSGARDKNDFVSFVKDKKYRVIDPVPDYKHPQSKQMAVVAVFFKLPMAVRDLRLTKKVSNRRRRLRRKIPRKIRETMDVITGIYENSLSGWCELRSDLRCLFSQGIQNTRLQIVPRSDELFPEARFSPSFMSRNGQFVFLLRVLSNPNNPQEVNGQSLDTTLEFVNDVIRTIETASR